VAKLDKAPVYETGD